MPLLTRRRRLPLEAVEALHDVPVETLLALLPIGDDIDPRFGLLADHVRHRVTHELVVAFAVVRLPAVLGTQERNERLRPGEAADVGGQDAVRASFHRVLLTGGRV
jgi:hypothetical protein